jgi:Fic family protein
MIDVCEITRFMPSEKTLRLVMDIAAALERYRIVMEGPSGVSLRKLNHIRTIRGTTAIEGNTLSEDEVTAIIAGKRVAGSKREIDEIKGAHAAYSKISEFNPLESSALLKAHALMTKNLVECPGKWRKCNVGVFNARGEAMHHAPPWDQVPFLMKDLFNWLKKSKDVPLVKSCIFHFVFETIHPFSDGNGRMGRFWQTAILGKWNELFYALPIENMVRIHQRRYYKALNESQKREDARAFVDFMLDMILRTLKAKGDLKGGKKKVVSKGGKKTAERLVEMMRKNPKVTLAEMGAELGISRSAIQKHILRLKDAQLVRRIGPDKGGAWKVES